MGLLDHLISQFHLRPYGAGYSSCFILISDKTFLSGYIPSFLGSNIKVVDWLPQNDLLGHKDIKAFVTHVGHNSLYESAYHGVPVVAVPLFADQFANAKKAEHFGLGLTVNHRSTTVQQLVETIELVVREPR